MPAENSLVQIRKELHRYAEISEREFQTARKVVDFARLCQPTAILENIGGTGVLVIFDSKKEGPTVLFRAELDALPIAEINEFEHQSKDDQVSHKCGHDGHMTILLGLAQRLSQEPIEKGKVVLLFQPAEEIGAGAKAVLSDDRFKKIQPDYVFALHNLPGFPLHEIVFKKDAFTASVKSLVARFFGETAHAAEPENGRNPALAMAKAIQKLESLENNDPKQADFSLITPVHMQLGNIDYGTSAGYGEIHLTMRTWNEDLLGEIFSKASEVIRSVARDYQLETEITDLHHFVSNNNHADAVDLIIQAAKELDLSLSEKSYPFKWGEDFGLFTQEYKGAMFGLGAGLETPALHNADYDFPDEIISTGVNLFNKISRKILK